MKFFIFIKQIFCHHEFERFDSGETDSYWWTEYRCKNCGEKKIVKYFYPKKCLINGKSCIHDGEDYNCYLCNVYIYRDRTKRY